MLLILLCILFLILISINLFKYREGGFFKRAGSSIRSAGNSVNNAVVKPAISGTVNTALLINKAVIRPAMTAITKYNILGKICARINNATGDLVSVC